MKKIRIGNDIVVKWRITSNGEPYDLENRDIELCIQNLRGSINIVDFVKAGNEVSFIYRGKDQSVAGVHSLILVENRGKDGMVTLDHADVFVLVTSSPCCGGEDDCSNITTECITLQSDVNMQGLSAYEIAVANGFEGTEAEWVDSLRVVSEEYKREVSAMVSEQVDASEQRLDGKFTQQIAEDLAGAKSDLAAENAADLSRIESELTEVNKSNFEQSEQQLIENNDAELASTTAQLKANANAELAKATAQLQANNDELATELSGTLAKANADDLTQVKSDLAIANTLEINNAVDALKVQNKKDLTSEIATSKAELKQANADDLAQTKTDLSASNSANLASAKNELSTYAQELFESSTDELISQNTATIAQSVAQLNSQAETLANELQQANTADLAQTKADLAAANAEQLEATAEELRQQNEDNFNAAKEDYRADLSAEIVTRSEDDKKLGHQIDVNLEYLVGLAQREGRAMFECEPEQQWKFGAMTAYEPVGTSAMLSEPQSSFTNEMFSPNPIAAVEKSYNIKKVYSLPHAVAGGNIKGMFTYQGGLTYFDNRIFEGLKDSVQRLENMFAYSGLQGDVVFHSMSKLINLNYHCIKCDIKSFTISGDFPNLQTIDGICKGCPEVESIVIEGNFPNLHTLAHISRPGEDGTECAKLKKVVLPYELPKLRNMLQAFGTCHNLEQVVMPVIAPNLEDLGDAFVNCSSLKEIVLPTEMPKLQKLTSAFANCTSLTKAPVLPAELPELTIMNNLWKGLPLTSIDFPRTPKLTDITATFSNMLNLERINGEIDGANDLFVDGTFQHAEKLKEVRFARKEGVIAKFMRYMFDCCYELEYVKLPNLYEGYWSGGLSLWSWFYRCNKLKTIDSGLWDCSKTRVQFNANSTFGWCGALENLSPGVMGGMRASFQMKDCKSLTRQSLLNLFNAIADITQLAPEDVVTNAPVLTLHADAKARLLPEDIALVTSKGWTIA